MQQLIQVDPAGDSVWLEYSGGSAPAVLLLHPDIADSRCWDPIWPQLTQRTRAVRFDVRGCGRSPAAIRDYTTVDDALAVLDSLSIDRAHLVGCSMGGQAALDLTVLNPTRVQSLTLLCPAVNGYPSPDEPELDAEYDALIEADDQEGLFQLGVRVWAAAGADPFIVDLMRAAGAAQANENEYQKQKPATFDRLGEIAMPTVVMVGEVDNPVLTEGAVAAAGRIPNCELIRMPGVDHFPMLREPELVLRTILQQVAA